MIPGMSYLTRAGTHTEDPRLGRLPSPGLEQALAQYPVRKLFTNSTLYPYGRRWKVPSVALDQHGAATGVGFAFTHELMTLPRAVRGVNNETARLLYWAAQQHDPYTGGSWPGSPQPRHEGTSIEAGAAVLVGSGMYRDYYWTRDEEELATAIANLGPVVLGLDWHEGMLTPDADGFLHPDGPILGGHAVLAYAVNVRFDCYRVLNSWGSSWGESGTAKIRRSDLAKLLAAGGEACLPRRGRSLSYREPAMA